MSQPQATSRETMVSPRPVAPADERSRTRVLFVVYEESWLGNDTIFGQLGKRLPVRAVSVRKRSPTAKLHIPGKALLALEETRHLLRLVRTRDLYGGSWILVASTAHFSTLLFGRLLKLLRRGSAVYLYNFYLHGLGGRRLVKSALKFLLDQDVRLMVQSVDELDYFRALKPSIDVRYTPYCQGPLDVDDAPVELGEYVFSGGHTNRDYDALLRCARALPQIQFVVVASSRNRIREGVPSNTTLLFDLTQASFYRLLLGSRLVVVPLLDSVGSSGQMVTLAAMEFGKGLVVPDLPVVHQYVDHGSTGFVYEHGDDGSLRDTIRAAYADEKRLAAVGLAAQKRYEERFRRRRFDEAVVAHVLDSRGTDRRSS
jgi:glycosyltransferase involved in cell wall biosynthesis